MCIVFNVSKNKSSVVKLVGVFALIVAVSTGFSITAEAQFSNGQAASVVIGQKTFSRNGKDNLDSLDINQPYAVAVDPTNGQVYVADTYNNRVLRYANASTFVAGSGAIGVLGQPDFYTSQSSETQHGMNQPEGVAVDATGNLYVSDTFNSRVLKFTHAALKANGANADTVLGQPDFTTTSYQTTQSGLSFPNGLAVDGVGNLYVVDNGNQRVVIYLSAASKGNGANADIVLGQADFVSASLATTQNGMSYPIAAAVDTAGNLYVADNSNSRVLKFAHAASKANGAPADAVLGQMNFTSTTISVTQSGLSYPTGLAVDRAGNLFVADGSNSRVLKYSHAASKTNGANADTVLGQSSFSLNNTFVSQNGFIYPAGLAIDTADNLYVTDFNSSRVMRFDHASSKGIDANADAVLGHATFIDGRTNNLDSLGMDTPAGLAVDPTSGTLYIVDGINSRVLRYASAASYISGHGAIGVLGQPDFGASSGQLNPAGMNQPTGAAVDTAGNLYVADESNNRVLIYLKAASKSNGADADIVLGEPNGGSTASATTQNGMSWPNSVAVDKAGNLYVSDKGNNRVLKFVHASSKATGANADVVLGQPNFVSDTYATTQTGMSGPEGLALDEMGNLYVTDDENNRVLRFDTAASKTNGADADAEFGEPDFNTNSGLATSSSNFYFPSGVAVDDEGTLYVADDNNHRVLLFSNAATKGNYPLADVVLGQPDFGSSSSGTSSSAMYYPTAIAINSSTGTVYVADGNNNRVLVFDASGTLAVQLYSFTSSLQQAGHVVLQWSTATETNNYGFYIQRTSTVNGAFADLPGNFIVGHGTTLQPQSYSWIDTTAGAGTYYYRLKQVDLTGAVAYSKTITIHVSGVEGIKTAKGLPKEFSLSQNYPNPFNPTTQIEYALPKAAHVALSLYNTLGGRVATLLDEEEEAGYKSVRLDGSRLSSGVYFYRLTAGTYSAMKKIVLMK